MKNVANCTLSPDVKSLKVAIQTLETRLQTFRSRQDWWNEGYLRLGLATLVLAVLLGGLSLFCQRKASNIELSSRPFAEELGRKNALLGEATDQAAQLEPVMNFVFASPLESVNDVDSLALQETARPQTVPQTRFGGRIYSETGHFSRKFSSRTRSKFKTGSRSIQSTNGGIRRICPICEGRATLR